MTAGVPAPDSASVSVVSGIPFTSPAGYRPVELDVYRPQGVAGVLPVVIYVHGGGWRQGTRRSASPAYRTWHPSLLERVAASGFVVVSVDYRLSGEAHWPAPLDDVLAALSWVAKNADTHAIDLGRVVVWGDSAGGQLATLAVASERASIVPCAVVNWYPVTDLVGIEADAVDVGGPSHEAPDSRETLLLGGPISESQELARSASPLYYLSSGLPPFLLMHGRADVEVPFAQSARLAEALATAGGQVELVGFEGLDHLWRGAPDERLVEILAHTISFLKKQTAAAPPTA